jgi:uncharacterized protein YkwD
MWNTSFMTRAGVIVAVVLFIAVAPARLSSAFVPGAAAVVGNCTPESSWGTNRADYASQVVGLVNQHRQGMGLNTLAVSPTLTKAAQWKALHMAGYGYMAHNDPAPPVARTPGQRLEACGYPVSSAWWGENIAYGYQTPSAVMNGWLNSPGHKANIENANYRAIGAGAAQAANGTMYWSQEFGSIVDAGSGGGGGGTSAPTVTLTTGPGMTTTATGATFGWSTSGLVSSTTCSLDGGSAVMCSSPWTYSNLAVGPHSFRVTVSNSGGSSSASYNWTVNSPTTGTPPTVSLGSVPSSSTTSTSASFSWSTTGTVSSTTCKLDSGTAVACTSPKAYSGLAAGGHTFTVTVGNSYGSRSATYSWTITSSTPTGSAPTVTITSGPGASTTSTSASFAWSTTGTVSSTTCQLDSGAAAACTSPKSYSGLAAGAHRFTVTVSNSYGTRTSSYAWTVGSGSTGGGTAPKVVLTTKPASVTTLKTATFAWLITGNSTSVKCSLDGAAAVACSSPTSYPNLASGNHSFRLTVANGGVSAYASYNWRIQ